MPILDNLRMCVNKKPALKRRPTKVPFHVPIESSFKNNHIPSQLKDLLVYIAREGVAVNDLFRRPGNPKDMKIILSDLQSGKKINWHDYNFYTLANVSKKFLLNIEGGILGPVAEKALIRSLDLPDDHERIEAMHRAIMSQPKHIQKFLALLFGIWFRMIYHCEVNAMSVEAVAKSVAGSVFPNHCLTPMHVEEASKVMEYLITGFASQHLFGRELIEYFTMETKTGISRVEKFEYELVFPASLAREFLFSAYLPLLGAGEERLGFINKVLMREAQQKGFDLTQHVVDKATYEATNWTYRVSLPQSAETSRSALEEKENQPHRSFSSDDRENATLTSTRTTTKKSHEMLSESGQVRSTPLLVTTTTNAMTPKLQRHASTASKHAAASIIESGVESTGSSEKRTRLDDSLRKSQTGLSTSAKRITLEYEDADDPRERAIMLRASAYNSLRRRQLERLKKRADWFLSPPTGKRTTDSARFSSLADTEAADEAVMRLSQSHSCYEGFTKSPSTSERLRADSQSNSQNRKQIERRFFVVQRDYGLLDDCLEVEPEPCPYHYPES
ncbi:hypothetical protein Ciccas_000598 [Cichlidogyrus casuarinus]|uniref:Rho-GAP domain-containing protein n=1 Tax=Cichlidogyrus casuarinus TaxID=1844966 RepID=A0ABD2QMF7_9PLAT